MPRFPVERLFQAFSRAGLLVTVVHQPGTAGEQRFSAQWTRPDQLLLGGDAQGTDRQLEYERAGAPLLQHGDRLDLVHSLTGAVIEPLRVRGDPMVQGDGTYARVYIDPL